MAEDLTRDEERLLALHHGELDPAEAEALRRALEGDPVAQALLAEWQTQDAALEALFAPVAGEPVPPHLSAIVQGARPRRFPLLQAAAVVGALAVGLAGGWFGAGQFAPNTVTPGPERSLVAEAIAAHETYVVEVLHPVEVAADQPGHLSTWLSKRVGTPLSPPDLAPRGFHLMGGRVLPGTLGPTAAAMLMYEDAEGHRLSLYVEATPGQSGSAFRFAEDGAMQSVWWSDEGFSCAVVGEMPRAELQQIARDAYDHLI